MIQVDNADNKELENKSVGQVQSERVQNELQP